MPPEVLPDLPFETREHFRFPAGTTFQLSIKSRCNSAAAFYITGATRDGFFRFQVIAGSTGAIQTNTFGIPDIPVWVSVIDADSNFGATNLWVTVTLAVNTDLMHLLVGGPVFPFHPISWPNVDNPLPSNVLGKQSTDTSTDPAAGVEASLNLPSNRQHIIDGVHIQLVTDGTVANRTVAFKFNDGQSVTHLFISPNAQTASTTIDYNGQLPTPSNLSTQGTVNIIQIPLGLLVNTNTVVSTVTTNLQAGDNYGVLKVTYRPFIVG